MRSKSAYYWILILIPVFFLLWFFVSRKEDKPARYLPFLGPRNYSSTRDTSYHTIPPFNFTNQYDETINESLIKNKIYVTEFFFTTCKSICPIMNTNLQTIYKEFQNDPEFLILSHTVDPDNDSVPVLAEYARHHGVSDRRWQFLTGPKANLYSIARKGYLLNAEEGDGGEEDFIHTQNFALIDKEQRIRGYYDGTDTTEIKRLHREIKLLKKEYDYKKRIAS